LQGDYQKAEEYFLLAAKGFEAEKSDYRAAEAAGSLIDLYLDSGDLTKALDLTEQSLQHYGNQRRPEFLVQQGDIYFELGDYAKAEGIYREALRGAQKAWEDFLATRDQKAQNINANLEDQPIYRHSKARLDLIKTAQSGRPEPGQERDGQG
jgi:tetratricopeptide (TPR) repeat protein